VQYLDTPPTSRDPNGPFRLILCSAIVYLGIAVRESSGFI
jgi:hypothetical protein